MHAWSFNNVSLFLRVCNLHLCNNRKFVLFNFLHWHLHLVNQIYFIFCFEFRKMMMWIKLWAKPPTQNSWRLARIQWNWILYYFVWRDKGKMLSRIQWKLLFFTLHASYYVFSIVYPHEFKDLFYGVDFYPRNWDNFF